MTKEAATPWIVAKAVGLDLYPWQKKILASCLIPGARVVVRAANETGKTTHVAAPLVLWHELVHPRGLVVLTSGTWRQVEEQLMPALRTHGHKFEGWEFTKTGFSTPAGGRCVAFSTLDAGKFEGWHGQGEDAPLLVVVDEAKTVGDEIFQAIERCRPDRLLVMSSPGGTAGYFFEACGRRAEYFTQHVVKAQDCAHIPPERLARQIAEWGEDHPLIRSSIFAEFMSGGSEDYAIPFLALDHLLQYPPAWVKIGQPVAFCDFAAGGDENVLAVRNGNRIAPEDLVSWRDKDTMAGVGRFIVEFRKRNLQAGQIWCDVGGLGAAMADALREAGWDVNRVNNGEAARDQSRFSNRGAEMWFESGRQIERGEINLPKDPVLTKQLTCRRRRVDSKGRLHLESKEDLRARGMSSPDRADAVCGAIANTPMIIHDTTFEEPNWLGTEPDRREPGVLAGAWAGM